MINHAMTTKNTTLCFVLACCAVGNKLWTFAADTVKDQELASEARFSRIENILETVLAKNIELTKQISELELKLDKQTQINKQLQQQLEDQKTTAVQVLKENTLAKFQIQHQAKKFTKLQIKCENINLQLNEQYKSTNDRTAKLKTIVSGERRKPVRTTAGGNESGNQKRQLLMPMVGPAAFSAFSAVISANYLNGLGQGQTIVFDKVITNMGDRYNNQTGKYSAPVSGVYAVNVAIMLSSGHDEFVQLVKDGKEVIQIYIEADNHSSASASRTVTLKLTKGESIWVRTAPNAVHGTGSIYGYGFSTFSAWLLESVSYYP